MSFLYRVPYLYENSERHIHKIMKPLPFFLMMLLLPVAVTFAQETQDPYDFLTVVIDQPEGEIYKVYYYPEGSEFTVQDDKGNTSTPALAYPGAFVYLDTCTLTVYPQYSKKRPHEFQVEGKRLRVFNTAKAAYSEGFGAGWNGDYSTQPKKPRQKAQKSSKKKSKYAYHSNGVTVEKKLTPSVWIPGTYNVRLTFSNGIVFTYVDGKSTAMYNGERVMIKGNYLIEIDKGTAKLSFDPSSGVVWWIFEKKRQY